MAAERYIWPMNRTAGVLGGSFVYACTFDESYAYDKFVPESVLAFQIAGETRIYHQLGDLVLQEGQILLARGNQFAKSLKIPPEGKEYRCILVLLTRDHLRQFALSNDIGCKERFQGKKNILLKPDALLRGYFYSLMPYLEHWKAVGQRITTMKVNEAIELLLLAHPELKSFLFDLSDPRKEDLEAFMLRNFHFNTPIEHFAKLSGRSLTSFKREFMEIFNMPPGVWLKNKRLSEAYYLIKKKEKKPQDIYLQLGFENLSHFYTSFKQKYGVTPSTIRQQNSVS
jgi:AraC family transcriptional regulator, exoenzyme S synthesis regulatory protein ExsA